MNLGVGATIVGLATPVVKKISPLAGDILVSGQKVAYMGLYSQKTGLPFNETVLLKNQIEHCTKFMFININSALYKLIKKLEKSTV